MAADPVLAWHEQTRDLQPEWLGSVIRRTYLRNPVPFFDSAETRVEVAALLLAFRGARDTFTMLELGAGFGFWTMRAAAVARSRNLRYRLVAVEAEPTHYQWLRQHAADNNVRRRSSTGSFRAVHAAVAARGGTVPFYVGEPRDWYGQAIAADNAAPGSTVKRVRAITLDRLLPRGVVDFIHLDIQGVEAEVLASTDLRRVRVVHVGTHSESVEGALREMFGRLGWEPIDDYTMGCEHDTPFGRIVFGDGAQTWVNPRPG